MVLSCSNNLGSCCNDPGMLAILSVLGKIIQIVQIVVPIVLLIILSVSLTQMLINPDDKKKMNTIKNQFIAAVVIFFIPMLANVVIGMLPDTGNYSVTACIKESNNIKLSASATYINPNKKKPTSVIGNSTDYEKGDEKKQDTSEPSGAVASGEKITAGEAVVGDNGVKVRDNIYHKKAAITRKLNGQEVVNYAMSWQGKLHYSHGTTAALKEGGSCDCSQFIYQVLKHFDAVESEAPSIYCSMWASGAVKGTVLYSNLKYLVPGDVVHYYWSPYSQHVEIYAGGNNTIGCDGDGVSVGHRANKYMTFIHLTAYD